MESLAMYHPNEAFPRMVCHAYCSALANKALHYL